MNIIDKGDWLFIHIEGRAYLSALIKAFIVGLIVFIPEVLFFYFVEHIFAYPFSIMISVFAYLFFLVVAMNQNTEDKKSREDEARKTSEKSIEENRKRNLLYGLRNIYSQKQRLPMFICKHCLKTIIVKNMNVVCPHCDAEFIMNDNKNSKQVGDTFIKGARNLVDESTIEKVLFKGCLVCSGVIEFIDCYHCGKEINIFEEYKEVDLKKKRLSTKLPGIN